VRDTTAKPLGIQEFGDRLIETRDLDPLYCGLVGADLDRGQLARYLLAYFCFYHAGASAWLSENSGDIYWQAMAMAARNEVAPSRYGLPGERWPRAAERRHFRGDKCVKAVKWLADHYPNADLAVPSLVDGYSVLGARAVMARVQKWPLFGWKVADMMETVWGSPVEFPRDFSLMYEEPRAALALIPEHHSTWTRDTPAGYYGRLLTYFSARQAPPGSIGPAGPKK
jgi:hypothetical protein